MEQERNLQEIGLKILRAAQSQLYMALPYMDSALCALVFLPGEDRTMFVATDGETLFYNSSLRKLHSVVYAKNFIRISCYIGTSTLALIYHYLKSIGKIILVLCIVIFKL